MTKKELTFKEGYEILKKNTELLESQEEPDIEPYRVCRRPLFLRECPDEKSKIHP